MKRKAVQIQSKKETHYRLNFKYRLESPRLSLRDDDTQPRFVTKWSYRVQRGEPPLRFRAQLIARYRVPPPGNIPAVEVPSRTSG